MKLTTSMFTIMGFISSRDKPQQPETADKKPLSKKYYVGISGGGGRALAGHMGAFRALSNKNALPTIDMFSSVSGGTWFLTKFAFDEKFSRQVLRNETHIAEAVLDWMERGYFPVIRDTTRMQQKRQSKDNSVATFVSTLMLRAPEPIKASLSSAVIAVNHFNFSWQEFVEQAVLGQGIDSHSRLANTKLTPEARAKFGDAILAFNWNQLHHWGSPSTCSKWFLKRTVGQQRYVQNPVYTSALYHQLGDNNISVEVMMQGKKMGDLFDVCSGKKDDFCGSDNSTNPEAHAITDMFSWFRHSAEDPLNTTCGKFEFRELTVGQVASASSAAIGAGAVQAFVQNVIEFVRKYARDTMAGPVSMLSCSIYRMLIENLVGPCNRNAVIDEFHKVLGCTTEHDQQNNVVEDSAITAKRWVGFLQKMAIQMTVSGPLGNDHKGHMAVDAGYNDNSGIGPILAHYLQDDADQAQILVLVINQLGDHQKNMYFASTDSTVDENGGLLCEGEAGMEEVFAKMTEIHRKSFQDLGGEYIEPDDNEKTCAMPLPPPIFFEGDPPQNRHFNDKTIPAHITYAYKKDARIVRNDDFYNLPEGETRTVDLLFLIASAPVETMPFLGTGSESYVGLAIAMELAMNELSKKFPAFFVEENKPSNECKSAGQCRGKETYPDQRPEKEQPKLKSDQPIDLALVYQALGLLNQGEHNTDRVVETYGEQFVTELNKTLSRLRAATRLVKKQNDVQSTSDELRN